MKEKDIQSVDVFVVISVLSNGNVLSLGYFIYKVVQSIFKVKVETTCVENISDEIVVLLEEVKLNVVSIGYFSNENIAYGIH